MRLDLHMHTTASDGELPPEAVVLGAVDGALDLIAITDHDTTASVAPARAAAAGSALRILAGTELSASWEGHSIHMLGYAVDPSAPVLVEHERRAKGARRARMERMIERLRTIEGIDVTIDEVIAVAGPDHEVLGRPHLARVLIARGHVRDLPEAFTRYIGNSSPAYVNTDLLTPEEAIEVVVQAGGVPVWAHPPIFLIDTLLDRLADAGLRGLEVYRPELRPAHLRRIGDAARSRGLVATGGSDWHNRRRNEPIGAFWIGGSRVQDFLALVGIDPVAG